MPASQNVDSIAVAVQGAIRFRAASRCQLLGNRLAPPTGERLLQVDGAVEAAPGKSRISAERSAMMVTRRDQARMSSDDERKAVGSRKHCPVMSFNTKARIRADVRTV
jgi:hypothetical protein